MAFKTVIIDSWPQFREIAGGNDYRSWAFRGHSDARWNLFSALSRYLKTFNVHPDAWRNQEERIIRVFRRKAHLFLNHIPEEDDTFQWLSLMQHHGAPTRLVDFTWSPFVAAFFVLERASSDAAIWALFPPKLHNRKIRTIRASQKTDKNEMGPWIKGNYEKNFLPNAHRVVIIGEPDQMNQRLIAQSGTFVMPGVLDVPIEELANEDAVTKFILATHTLRRDALRDLYTMNISHSTLFPGLDGLARSLAYELEFHWAYDPVTMEYYKGFSIE